MRSPSPSAAAPEGRALVPTQMFDRVTIVGVGLIGGSLGMALRARGVAREVVGVTRVEASIVSARAARAIDRGTVDPAAGVAGADLVVLAVPPDQVVPMARRVAPHLQPGALLTDVASVKAEIVGSIEVLQDRKSTRLNSSHGYISYAVF